MLRQKVDRVEIDFHFINIVIYLFNFIKYLIIRLKINKLAELISWG